MPLLDAHVHLQEEVLEGLVPEVLARARGAGVEYFVSNGTHVGDWESTRAIAATEPGVVPCFGLHPWFIAEQPPDWPDRLEEFLRATPSGIGEAGLDGSIATPALPEQTEALRIQLRLAHRLGRPVMLHCVRAFGHLLDLLRQEGPPEAGFLLHSYSGAPEMVKEFAPLGGWFSISGAVLHERHKRARRALMAVPLDRLVVETDAPAMPPPPPFRPHQLPADGGRCWNEPANLPQIVEGVAGLRGLTAAALTEIAWDNARRFLGELLCTTNDSPVRS